MSKQTNHQQEQARQNQRRPDKIIEKRVAILQRLGRMLGEAWQYFRHGRVRLRYKVLPVFGALYVVFPFDLVPEALFGFLGPGFLGLGFTDDVVVFLVALWLFIRLAKDQLERDAIVEPPEPNPNNLGHNSGPTIDGTCKVVS